MDLSQLKKRMNSGEIYYETEELSAEQAIYRDLLFHFNHTVPSQGKEKEKILQ